MDWSTVCDEQVFDSRNRGWHTSYQHLSTSDDEVDCNDFDPLLSYGEDTVDSSDTLSDFIMESRKNEGVSDSENPNGSDFQLNYSENCLDSTECSDNHSVNEQSEVDESDNKVENSGKRKVEGVSRGPPNKKHTLTLLEPEERESTSGMCQDSTEDILLLSCRSSQLPIENECDIDITPHQSIQYDQGLHCSPENAHNTRTNPDGVTSGDGLKQQFPSVDTVVPANSSFVQNSIPNFNHHSNLDDNNRQDLVKGSIPLGQSQVRIHTTPNPMWHHPAVHMSSTQYPSNHYVGHCNPAPPPQQNFPPQVQWGHQMHPLGYLAPVPGYSPYCSSSNNNCQHPPGVFNGVPGHPAEGFYGPLDHSQVENLTYPHMYPMATFHSPESGISMPRHISGSDQTNGSGNFKDLKPVINSRKPGERGGVDRWSGRENKKITTQPIPCKSQEINSVFPGGLDVLWREVPKECQQMIGLEDVSEAAKFRGYFTVCELLALKRTLMSRLKQRGCSESNDPISSTSEEEKDRNSNGNRNGSKTKEEDKREVAENGQLSITKERLSRCHGTSHVSPFSLISRSTGPPPPYRTATLVFKLLQIGGYHFRTFSDVNPNRLKVFFNTQRITYECQLPLVRADKDNAQPVRRMLTVDFGFDQINMMKFGPDSLSIGVCGPPILTVSFNSATEDTSSPSLSSQDEQLLDHIENGQLKLSPVHHLYFLNERLVHLLESQVKDHPKLSHFLVME